MRGLKKLFSVEVRIRNSFVLLKLRNVYLSNWALRYFFREEDSYPSPPPKFEFVRTPIHDGNL